MHRWNRPEPGSLPPGSAKSRRRFVPGAEVVNPPRTEPLKNLHDPIDTRTGICDNLARVYEIVSMNTQEIQ
jgi:hypothetical protein